MKLRFVVLVLFGCLMVPAAANAQLAFAEKLIGRVTDATMFLTRSEPWGMGRPSPSGLESGTGFGFELLFSIGTSVPRTVGRMVCPRSPTISADSLRKLGRPAAADSLDNCYQAVDTTFTLTAREVTKTPVDGVVRTTIADTHTATIGSGEKGRILYELGISYSDIPVHLIIGDSVELRASVRSLPAVSVYATKPFWVRMYAYGGARVRLSSLTGLRAYTSQRDTLTGGALSTSKIHKGGGDGLQGGLLAGIGAGYRRLNAFVDLEFGQRSISSIQWEADIPRTLPRRLELSPWTLSAGVQIGARSKVFPGS